MTGKSAKPLRVALEERFVLFRCVFGMISSLLIVIVGRRSFVERAEMPEHGIAVPAPTHNDDRHCPFDAAQPKDDSGRHCLFYRPALCWN